MKTHLDYGIRLQTETEYKSLYSWAINEVDADGHLINRDQIPWVWTLWFTAVSCDLVENFEIRGKYADDENFPSVTSDQVIRMKLRPGVWVEENFVDQVSYSMFGTSRTIGHFILEVRALSDQVKTERCAAWGSVSYTHEIEFRHETTNDCLWFYLYVRPEKFARYAELIDRRAIYNITLSVGSVSGFYSDWSPSISTDKVKVLLDDSDHKVQCSSDLDVKLPRIGRVSDARLMINTRLELEASS